jgi:hypothetical protein
VTNTVAMVVQPSPVPGPEDPGGRGEDFGKSSPVGLLLLILFGIAVAFLIRSMTKHLKKLPTTFDEQRAAEAAPRRARRAAERAAADDAEGERGESDSTEDQKKRENGSEQRT